MTDVARWLENIGLGQYAELFAENDIDLEVLSELTDADLKDLGISLGHRKKLLKASRDLGEIPPPPGERAPAPRARPSRQAAEPERRQLTVMFCDLVGSTALSQKLDPEDYREVIKSFQKAASDAVRHFDGHVAKYLGDGLLAYFGYPQAHEDDAERAVRSGLASVETIRELTPHPGVSLDARVGIATGLVVAGDIADGGVSEEGAISGETPNLAARLQSVAKPGSVVIGESTHRLVGDLFECMDLGPQQLKGIDEHVLAYHVAGERVAASRFEARHPSGVTEFVGRELELQTLLHHWGQAKDGEGQVVLISGEPGIGKSRLAERLHEQLARERHVRVLCQCSPHHRNSALYPLINQLLFAAGISLSDPAPVRLDKLEALLAQGTEEPSSVAPLFADLLSIPYEDRYTPLSLTPQAQKTRTLDALTDQLFGLAENRPVLMVFEDLHWVDPTTQELLELMVDRIQQGPVLALLTFRPEYQAPWIGQPHVHLMALSRLTRRQCTVMARNVATQIGLADALVEDVVSRTEGVPLFIEELTRALREGGRSDAVPTTIQASLLARLDALGAAKEIAQVGAVIGREFGYRLLAAVLELDEASLRERLTALTKSQLVFARGTAPDTTYVFKHALVQDAAYGSILRANRRSLHARVGEVLKTSFPETVETAPELLARHLTEAEATEEAVDYWQKAGQRAAGRSADNEAVSHFAKGLELLRSFPESSTRDQKEIALLTSLGVSLIAAKGYAVPEVKRSFERARQLRMQQDDPSELFRVLRGLWIFQGNRAQHRDQEGLTKELLELAQRENDPLLLAEAHYAAAMTSFFLGRFPLALDHMEQAVAHYSPERHHLHATLYGQDPGVACLIRSALVLFYLGYPVKAKNRAIEAMALAQELNHPLSLAYAMGFASILDQIRGDIEQVKQRAEAQVALSEAQGLPYYAPWGVIMKCWALSRAGDHSATLIDEMRDSINR